MTVSIISQRRVETNIFRRELARQIQVTIRDHHKTKQTEKLPSDILKHDKVIRHAGYSSDTHHHDIALIRLKEPVVWDDLMEPACLPDSQDTDFEGLSGIVAGWGRLSEGKLAAPSHYNNLLALLPLKSPQMERPSHEYFL